MKKFLVMACIAAASMIALPAVAQTTTGSKTQTECCKKGKADCKKECNCTDCKCKDCKATATDISTFIFGLHNSMRRAQAGALPMGAPRAFLLFQALHTGRTYLKNRAQSW